MLDTLFAQNVNNRERRAIGIVCLVIRIAVGKLIVRVEAGELIDALHILFLKPALRHVQQIEIFEEIRHGVGKHHQGRLDGQFVIKPSEFGREGHQQPLQIGLSRHGDPHATAIQFATGKGAQIKADHDPLQPLPRGLLSPHHLLDIDDCCIHAALFLFLSLGRCCGLPGCLEFLRPLIISGQLLDLARFQRHPQVALN